MTFLHPLPWWLLAVLTAAAIGWARFAAGGATSGLGSAQRASLVLLRVLVVLLLGAILMRPVRMGAPPDGSRPVVAILVDASRSMGLAGPDGAKRIDQAMALAQQVLAPALRSRFTVRLFTFGDRLQPIDAATPVAAAPAADLGNALRALPSGVGAGRLAGAVVLSDGGIATEVDGPARPLDVPVFAVGVGNTSDYRDREVLDVSIDDAAFAESTVDLTAAVVSRGLDDSALDVVVLADGTPVAMRRVELRDGVPSRVTTAVRAAADRPVRFTVRLATAAGELTSANNEASVLSPPARRRATVLLVEGAPGFEHSFLKRALERDPAISADAVVPKGHSERGDPAFYIQASADRAPALVGGWPDARSSLFAYDAVVLANASLRALSRGQLDQLAEFVGHRGGGLVALGADAADADAGRRVPFSDVLPLDPAGRLAGVARASRGERRPGAVWLTPAGEAHPVMRLPGEGDIVEKWSAMPVLGASLVVGQPRPGASVLAMVAGPGGEAQPLVTVQRYGRGRALAFTGEASWRWRMLVPSDDSSYETFWRQAVRWAAAPAPGLVELAVSRSSTGSAHAVVDVNDAGYEPVSDAEVTVRLSGPSGEAEFPARPDPERAGRYVASFDARAAGVYRVAAEPGRGAAPLASGESWMLAGGIDHEMRDPRRDDAALGRMAEAWGGRLVGAGELRAAASLFDRPSPAGAPGSPIDVWHNAWVFLLVVGLCCLEWALRRRWGLR